MARTPAVYASLLALSALVGCSDSNSTADAAPPVDAPRDAAPDAPTA